MVQISKNKISSSFIPFRFTIYAMKKLIYLTPFSNTNELSSLLSLQI